MVRSAWRASKTVRRRARIEFVTATAALTVALIGASPVAGAAGANQGRPIAVVEHGPGTAEVYWKGTDGYLWENAEAGGQWRGAARTPIGPLGSDPAATVGPAGSDYVFWQRSDAALWRAAWTTSGGWSAPTRLGMGPLGSQPAVTVTPPAPIPKHRQIRVKIFMKWTWNGRHTRLRALRFARFPGPGTIGISCHGRGCFRHASRAGHRGLRALIRSLERRLFSSGQRLIITVSAPGYEAERAKVLIRNGALPIARLL